jgi:hypothetical protein
MATRITILFLLLASVASAQVTTDTKDIQVARQKLQVGTDNTKWVSSIVEVIDSNATHRQSPTARAVWNLVDSVAGTLGGEIDTFYRSNDTIYLKLVDDTMRFVTLPVSGITGSGLANRLGVWFAPGVMGYENTLRVDSINNRLGIGVSSVPSYNLDILSTDNIGFNLSSNNILGTSLQFANTSVGGKAWTISVGGSAGSAANLGDIYFFNQTDTRFGSFTIDGGTGAADFWRSNAADVRFYSGSSQIAKIRASDGLFGAPFFAAYNDVTFGLAQTTATNIKAGLNLGSAGLLEWSSGVNWYSVKDIGLKRGGVNILDVSDGSSGYGNVRLNVILGKGTTSSTYSLIATNSSGNTSTAALAVNDALQTSFGTNAPVATAKVQIESITQGFLPPRMTTTQRDAISSPAAGLIIYNTTTNKHQGYDGSTWNDFY